METNATRMIKQCGGGFYPTVDKNGDHICPTADPPDLYKVRGLAPTYTNDLIGGVFENLTMNWWVFRRGLLKVNYLAMISEPISYDLMIAISQLFLLREAEMFKEWIDAIYPEENTELIKVDYPFKDTTPYPPLWSRKKKCGSFFSNPLDWLYDLTICYYIDTNNVKVRAT